ncbi:ADP-ribosylglycohydrolase-like protein 2 [Sarcoptes scabiei]|uniref:ADP-ribosylglycohydrolase-like protein 2 n=1 Tax=Sarcoptes scabiei TaxID=52283 RepID=A0A132ACX3_SARSC|nr:ADP-ribosylglycohydrolase-like protein 2 [Sarcoptes scabiei]
MSQLICQFLCSSEYAIGFQILNYTDDTAMTKSIAQSLIEIKKFDPKDIAKRFALEYNKEPKRGYGTNVVDVFAALMLANYEAPYEPAKRQFGGFGSYGELKIIFDMVDIDCGHSF